MKITFLLPFASDRPIGGFKIVFEYANRLAEKGHEVKIVFPSFTFKEGLFNNAKYAARYLQRKLDGSYKPKWFMLNEKVELLWVRQICNEEVPDSDVVIATAWRTAKCAKSLSNEKGRKYYFIQHYETWNGPVKEVIETWKMPFKKIVISKWLKEIAESLGESADYIPNGLDFAEFGMDIKPAERDPGSVMMLYSNLEFKGADLGINAITDVMNEEKDVCAVLFGTCKRPSWLSERIKYYESPERDLLRKLYNESAVFLGPSISEGFGLTGAEAMMCGCSVAASDNGGHREFAIHNKTALVFEPGNVQQMKDSLTKLINDRELRFRLAYSGNEFIKTFTWESSVNKFEKALADH